MHADGMTKAAGTGTTVEWERRQGLVDRSSGVHRCPQRLGLGRMGDSNGSTAAVLGSARAPWIGSATYLSRRVGVVDCAGGRCVASVVRTDHGLVGVLRCVGRSPGIRPGRCRRPTAHHQPGPILAPLAGSGLVAFLLDLHRAGGSAAQNGTDQGLGPDHRQQFVGCLVAQRSQWRLELPDFLEGTHLTKGSPRG